MLPAALRHQVLSLLADPSPAAAARRLAIGQRIGPLGLGGFPRPAGPSGMSRLLLHPARAGAGAAGAAAVIGGTLLVLQPWQTRVPRQPVPPVPSASVPAAAPGGSARPPGPGNLPSSPGPARPGPAASALPGPARAAGRTSAGRTSGGQASAANPGPALSVSRASGSLAAGHSVRITVSALAGLLPGAVLDVAPGGTTVPVSIQLGG